jgi:hypothetical protein
LEKIHITNWSSQDYALVSNAANKPLKRTRGAQFFLPVLAVSEQSIVIEALVRIRSHGPLSGKTLAVKSLRGQNENRGDFIH